jgi:hypothetical protein
MSSISGCALTGDLPGTHIHKMEPTGNDAHQNSLAIRAKVKSLHKQEKIPIYKGILKPIWTYGTQL